MPLKESGEMYLETIYVLSKTGAAVRSLDVAEHMGYSKPSVSRAMGLLRNEGYITVDENGSIMLTPDGEKLAEKIYDRHTTLTKIFALLGVREEVAAQDACRIEHVISDESFNAIKEHFSKYA